MELFGLKYSSQSSILFLFLQKKKKKKKKRSSTSVDSYTGYDFEDGDSKSCKANRHK